MTSPELLPCPFCKRSLEHDESIGLTLHPTIPYGDYCPLRNFSFASDRRDIIAAWNTRAPSTVGVEALKNLLAWCQTERSKLVVDGYDYKSGEEFGIRRVELQIEKAIPTTLASEKEGVKAEAELPRFVCGRSDNDDPRMAVLCFGEPLTPEQHGEIARRVSSPASLIAKGEGK